MAKKSVQEVLRETRNLVMKTSAAFLEKLGNGEEITKDDRKHLKDMKSELKFVEGLYEKLHGKVGGDERKAKNELMDKLKDIQSSLGTIVKSIPKN